MNTHFPKSNISSLIRVKGITKSAFEIQRRNTTIILTLSINVKQEYVVYLICRISSRLHYVLCWFNRFNTNKIRIPEMCILLSESSSLCTLSFMSKIAIIKLFFVLRNYTILSNGEGLLEFKSIRDNFQIHEELQLFMKSYHSWRVTIIHE